MHDHLILIIFNYLQNDDEEQKLQKSKFKISQGVTSLLPKQCLNNIFIMREEHCWTNIIVQQLFQQYCSALFQQYCSAVMKQD